MYVFPSKHELENKEAKTPWNRLSKTTYTNEARESGFSEFLLRNEKLEAES